MVLFYIFNFRRRSSKRHRQQCNSMASNAFTLALVISLLGVFLSVSALPRKYHKHRKYWHDRYPGLLTQMGCGPAPGYGGYAYGGASASASAHANAEAFNANSGGHHPIIGFPDETEEDIQPGGFGPTQPPRRFPPPYPGGVHNVDQSKTKGRPSNSKYDDSSEESDEQIDAAGPQASIKPAGHRPSPNNGFPGGVLSSTTATAHANANAASGGHGYAHGPIGFPDGPGQSVANAHASAHANAASFNANQGFGPVGFPGPNGPYGGGPSQSTANANANANSHALNTNLGFGPFRFNAGLSASNANSQAGASAGSGIFGILGK